MATTNFNTTILVDQTPKEVFDAVMNVRGWWSEEIEGNTTAEFNYHFEDIHRATLKVVEFEENKRVVWHVLSNYFKPGIFENASNAFAHDKSEWTDTRIIFDISEQKGKTRLHFVHDGLVPEYECYDVCSNGWNHYIGQSLMSLITTGEGQPNKTGKPMTSDEEKFHASGQAE
jgi:hypothetical protein